MQNKLFRKYILKKFFLDSFFCEIYIYIHSVQWINHCISLRLCIFSSFRKFTIVATPDATYDIVWSQSIWRVLSPKKMNINWRPFWRVHTCAVWYYSNDSTVRVYKILFFSKLFLQAVSRSHTQLLRPCKHLVQIVEVIAVARQRKFQCVTIFLNRTVFETI